MMIPARTFWLKASRSRSIIASISSAVGAEARGVGVGVRGPAFGVGAGESLGERDVDIGEIVALVRSTLGV